MVHGVVKREEPVNHKEGETPDTFLDPIVEHIREHGLADSSLRRLAAVAGTSHRMLVYYYGSRDAVLGAVMRALRREESADLLTGVSTRRELMERAWAYFGDPRRGLEMRLFFYLAGHAVHDPATGATFSDSVVTTWSEGLIRLGVAEGVSEERAAIEARLLVDASRGLFLDRLLTDEVDDVYAAFTHLLDLML